MLKKIKTAILDTLFPIHCISCHKEGAWFCHDCLNKIQLLSFQECPFCEKVITEKGAACPKCKNDFLEKGKIPPIDSLLVATKYSDKNIARLIHLYKYNFIPDLSVPLGYLLTKALLENNIPLVDYIIPIPLHPRRLRWRGFNQSEKLGDYISQNLAPGFSIPVYSDLIIRKRYTPPQMKIKSYQERQKNMEGIFQVSNSKIINNGKIFKDKTILLIDDVATTGSTLFECGKIIKQGGAKKVYGTVIARQEISIS